MNETAINIHVQVFSSVNRNGIAGLYGKCMFNFIRNCQTVFQNGYTILSFFPAVFSEFLLILWFQFMSLWLLIKHHSFLWSVCSNFAYIFIRLFKLIIELWELFIQHFNICVVLILSPILWLDIFFIFSVVPLEE